MLEYDFNNLDNDFITVWSKFLLTQDKKLVVNEIEALAELGQINAVQSWYLVKQDKQNKYIDNIVKSYNGSNFNEYWAMANAINPTQTEGEVKESLEKTEDYCSKYMASKSNIFLNEVKSNSEFFKYLHTAIELAGNVKNNLYVNQRLAEMLLSYHEVLPIKTDKRYLKLASKVANNALKQMECVLNREANVYELLKNKPQLAFAVAKNHLFFSKKNKEIQFATDVLTDLSNRELSLELQKQLKIIKSRKSNFGKSEEVNEPLRKIKNVPMQEDNGFAFVKE